MRFLSTRIQHSRHPRFWPDELDADAAAWAATVTVSGQRLALVSRTIRAWKSIGVYQLADRLNIVGENALQTRTCWKSRITASFVSNPTFTADRGITSDGLSSDTNSNFTPSTDGVNFTLNSASMFVYTNTNRAAADVTIMGADNGDGIQSAIGLRNAAGNGYGYISNTFAAGAASGVAADTLGLNLVSRTASNLTTRWKDAASLGTTTVAANVLSNKPIAVGALNNNGTIIGYDTARVAAWGFLAGLSAAQKEAFRISLRDHLSAIGAA